MMGPHWLLNDEDARLYANAVNNVARHYDVGAAQKTIDIANLIGLACFIEGTRLLVSRSPAARQAAQQRPTTAQVVPIFQFDRAPSSPAMGFPPAPASAASSPAAEVYGPPNPLAPEGQLH